MSELTITTFLSLDGVMQAPGGPDEDRSDNFQNGGWVSPLFDEDMGKIIDENFSKVGAFLLGRKTYDIFAGYWPKITDPKDLIAKSLNTLPKYVASRTQHEFRWSGTAHLHDIVREIRELKKQHTGELQVHGSGDLAQTLIENDLIDEYRLFIFPVILGSGRRLFSHGARPASLKLVSTKLTRNGVLYNVYRPDGMLKTATIGE
jgi:dihydrofolate reductase